MKKIGIFLLVLMILPAILFARGAPEQGELRFGWWGNPTRNENTAKILGLFTQQTGIKVEPVTAGAFNDYWQILAPRAISRDLPDVMTQDVSRLVEYQQGNLLLDLRPFINDGRIDVKAIPPGVLEQGRIGDGIYGIPIGMNVAALVYNKTLLDSLGLSAPRNMTMDQFIQLSRDIYARSGVRASLVFGDAINWFHAMMRGQGQDVYILNPNGTFRQGGELRHYQRFFEVIEQGIREGWHISPEVVAGRGLNLEANPLVYPTDVRANAAQRSWFSVNWSGQIAAFQNLIEQGSQLALTTLPSDNPSRSNFGRASMFLSITSHAANPSQAARLISTWINNQEINQIDNTDRGLPINPNIVKSMTLSGPARLSADYVDWFNQPGNSSPFSALAPPGLAEFRSQLEATTDLVMSGKLTAAAAAQRMYAEGTRLIK